MYSLGVELPPDLLEWLVVDIAEDDPLHVPLKTLP
jgi:hypothetical protein